MPTGCRVTLPCRRHFSFSDEFFLVEFPACVRVVP